VLGAHHRLHKWSVCAVMMLDGSVRSLGFFARLARCFSIELYPACSSSSRRPAISSSPGHRPASCLAKLEWKFLKPPMSCGSASMVSDEAANQSCASR
jgi:hypothetical protein